MVSRRTLAPVLAAAALAAVTAATGAAAAVPASGSAMASRTAAAGALVPFTGEQLTGVSSFTDRGHLDGGKKITVDIALARPNPAGEAAYKAAEYEPGNALFHAFLTPSAFAAKFGVAASTYDAAVSFGTAHGMTVATATPARDLLVLTGSAAQAEATFSTTLESYTLAGTTFFANTNAPLVPAGLPLVGVFGLETMHRAKSMETPPKPAVAKPDQTTCTTATNVCLGDITPQDAWSMYDQPASDTGQGVKLSIFGMGAYDYVIKDLRQFETENKLPQVPISVVLADGSDDGTNYTDTGGDGEWQLDTQSSTGMAPDVKEIDLIWGSEYTYPSLLNIENTWVNLTNGSKQADASYGDCEPFTGSTATSMLPPAEQFDVSTVAYIQASEQSLSQAVMEGKTLFSSSGDTGSSCGALPVPGNGVLNEGTPGVGYPASSPNAVGVGGTVLYGTVNTAALPASNAKRSTEYAWTFSGGGPSAEFHEPAYQSAYAGTAPDTTNPASRPNTPCTYTVAGGLDTSLATCRKVPDVSAISGDAATNGYNIVDDGADTATGGTSLSSPLTVGLWTRIQSASCAVSAAGSSGLGFANYSFYTHPGDFFDPGGPTNSAPSSNGAYTSSAGYDEVTGLGVIDVAKMMKDLDGGSTTPCATPPTDLAPFPPTSATGMGNTPTGLPAASLPEVALPVELLLAAGAVGAVVVRRRRRAVVAAQA